MLTLTDENPERHLLVAEQMVYTLNCHCHHRA